MKRSFLLILCSFAIGCASLRSSENYKETFNRIYAQRATWTQTRDIDSLFSQMSERYVVRLKDGTTMNLANLRERWTFYYDKVLVRHIHFINDVQSVVMNGDTALVTLEQKDRRIQNGGEGKLVEVEANVIHTETWVRTSPGWKLTVTDEGRQTRLTIDGKPQSLQ